MNPFQILFVIFLLVPMLEIYLLIKVGSVIGALPTVFLVVFTAVLGALMLRVQGFSTLARLRTTMAQGGIPAVEMVEGGILLVAGALLLTPGFFTDSIGFLLLIPPVRRLAITWSLKRLFRPFDPRTAARRPAAGPANSPSHGPRTIEGEYRRDDD